MKHPRACSSLLAGALVVLGLADLSAAAQSQATNVPRRANDGPPDRIVLPVGLGTLVDDAGVPYFEARRDCQHVLSLTAQMAVRGSVGGAPARATLWAGTTAIDTVRLEPVSPMSRPDFVLVAKEGNATVRLQGPDRFTRGTAHDSIEAVTNLPLSGAELQGVLTGCPRISGNLQAWAFGRAQIRLIVGERDELHLRRIPLPNTWQLVAWIHTVAGRELRWRAEFYERLARNGVPRRIRLTSLEWNGETGRAFDVTLSLSRLQINPLLAPETFATPEPASPLAMTVDELRGSRPLMLRPHTKGRLSP